MSRLKSLLLTAAASIALLAPSANAQRFDLRIGKKTKRGGVTLTVGNGGAHVGYTRRSRSRHNGYRPYRRHSTRCCTVIAGHYRVVHEDVWVPGNRRRVWVPPIYDSYYDECGILRQRLVRAGCYEWIQDPGHYETRSRKVWVPGRTQCSSIVPH